MIKVCIPMFSGDLNLNDISCVVRLLALNSPLIHFSLIR